MEILIDELMGIFRREPDEESLRLALLKRLQRVQSDVIDETQWNLIVARQESSEHRIIELSHIVTTQANEISEIKNDLKLANKEKTPIPTTGITSLPG